jgi:hypothetical protein
VAYERRDVEVVFSGISARGFRVAATIIDRGTPNEAIGVLFDDGETLRHKLTNPKDRQLYIEEAFFNILEAFQRSSSGFNLPYDD